MVVGEVGQMKDYAHELAAKEDNFKDVFATTPHPSLVATTAILLIVHVQLIASLLTARVST